MSKNLSGNSSQYNFPFISFNNDKLKNKAISLYKTESCRNWTELGHCRYGRKCRYAHGEEELRSVPRHVRYKTQICRAYHMDGSCPYGIRCTFVHESPTDINSRRCSFGSQESSNLDDDYYYSNMKQQRYIETVYFSSKNSNTMITTTLWL